jgi:hypothetical protein
MKAIATWILVVAMLLTANAAPAKGDDFNSVVKMIEQFYRVKHVGIPFLAKAGMKVGATAARIKGAERDVDAFDPNTLRPERRTGLHFSQRRR